MSKVIITLIAIILSSSAAFAKDRINIKVEGKDVDFNHSGHAKYPAEFDEPDGEHDPYGAYKKVWTPQIAH